MHATFIRHGESETQAGIPTTEPGSAILTERGQQQAEAVAQMFDDADPPTLLVASPFIRTTLTRAPTAARFPDVWNATWPVEEFTYLRHSRFGKHSTQLDRSKAVKEYWDRADPFSRDYHEGEEVESLDDLFWRGLSTLHRVEETKTKHPVIFTHGLFMKALVWLTVNKTNHIDADVMRRFRRFCLCFDVPNTGVLTLSKNEHGWAPSSAVSIGHLPKELR